MSTSPYSAMQLDALRELANIGSGTAGTALAQMLGRPVDISIPAALALPLADAVDAVGAAETPVTAVLLPLQGDLDAVVLLVFPVRDAERICVLLGVEPDSEIGRSALGEVGNILGSSYVGALAALTGLALEPEPPQTAGDMLGAIVASVLAARSQATDVALILDSQLEVEGESCAISFLLLPAVGGVDDLLVRMGVET
ncbi:MAG: chemotaxis protein CheC [Solirubrobacteraceae bacterium]|nr:chemotaxis protein CheC [Solirubrobacteraceae bacterium]